MLTTTETIDALTAGDATGDGRADLVLWSATGTVTVAVGNGTGSFASNTPIPTEGRGPARIQLADPDRSADADVIVLAESSTLGPAVLVVIPGLGSGTFDSPQTLSVPSGSNRMVIADFNLDGLVDILVAGPASGNATAIMSRNGAPLAATTAMTWFTGISAMAGIDVNRDGRPDVAGVGASTGLLLNNLPQRPVPSFTASGDISLGAGATPGALVAVDWSNDGIPDIAAANSAGLSVSLLLTDAQGSASLDSSLGAPSGPVALAAADLNRDGVMDFVSANAGVSGSVTVSFGSTTSAPAQIQITVGAQPSAIALADLNRDGWLDIVVANSGAGTLSVVLGDGAGLFLTPASLVTVGVAGSAPTAIAVADLNRDGIPDLVVALGGNASVLPMTGNGNGTFILGTAIPVAANPRYLAVGDFNRDGISDVAVASAGDGASVAPSLTLLSGSAGGTMSAGAPMTFNATGTTPLAGLAIGDMDRDGADDLLVASRNTGAIVMFRNDGAGSFSPTTIPSGTAVSGIAIGDFNRDGRPDFAASNATSGSVRILTSR
jgi:hypothetical protein